MFKVVSEPPLAGFIRRRIAFATLALALLIALVLALAPLRPAFADGAPGSCESVETFVAHVAVAAPDYSVETVTDLRDAAAQDLVAFWNSLPPPSADQADRVVVLRGIARATGIEHPKWVVVLVRGGCVVGKASIPSALLQSRIPAA